MRFSRNDDDLEDSVPQRSKARQYLPKTTVKPHYQSPANRVGAVRARRTRRHFRQKASLYEGRKAISFLGRAKAHHKSYSRFRNRSDFRQALQLYKRVLSFQTFSKSRQLMILWWLGKLCLEARDTSQAKAYFYRYIHRHSRKAQASAYKKVKRAYLQRGIDIPSSLK